ncbi:5-(carboxyamino)imidazole ribonucleotide synthase [Curvivirga sp.]|uniref:5-(carboxyamino)imidazole ribonucleotide synthase n=1 Tax=Curvivirga sp. TaxID=2856848 RepID=UPI003B5C070E
MRPTSPSPRVIAPGSTIGILGGGQLGRMTALAAANLGYKCEIFEPQRGCPASQVSNGHIAGSYDNEADLLRFVSKVDVITLEFENVPVKTLQILESYKPMRPGPKALELSQDRIVEKSFLNNCGIPTAPWAKVETAEEMEMAVEKLGRPSVLKTARFGYDGKGQIKITEGMDVIAAWKDLNKVRCVLEGFVSFTKEISVIVARSATGETKTYEPVENSHKNHILDTTTVPASITDEQAKTAMDYAIKAVEGLELIGLLAVEMFVTTDGKILVNEVAPRPHNSGHWTQDACVTSQFEQLVRAVCGLPLGSVERLGRAEMKNLLGNDINNWPTILAEPGAHLHLYGKAEAKPGRKMGHVNRLFKD